MSLHVRNLGILPTPLTALVGREREILAVSNLFFGHSARLVTLTGPGGVGKTRVAIAAARQMADSFADGVRFIGLAPVRHADLVLPAIANALGLQESATTGTTAELIDHLREKHLLLLVDNFEHVIDAAPAITELLSACPLLAVLNTSRVRLHLYGENDLQVPPLTVPESTPHRELAEIAASESIQLFVERGQTASPAFALTETNAACIVEICRRLDGLPLAIELAAARLRVVSPDALLARMNPALALLSDGAHDLPVRQQTVRDTIAWSYELLNADEQSFFCHISVFVGGFSLEAAEEVARRYRMTAPAALRLLTALVDANLLRPEPQISEQTRYLMLETVREFGIEQLVAAGDLENARHDHAEVAYILIARCEPHIFRGFHQDALDTLAAEHDNLRVAVEYACATRNSHLALRLGGPWAQYCYARGLMQEGWSTLNQILSFAPPDPTPERAAALVHAGLLATAVGEFAVATRFAREALEIWTTLNNPFGCVASLNVQATAQEMKLNWQPAETLMRQELAILRNLDAIYDSGFVLTALSGVIFGQGRVNEARALAREAAAIFRRFDEKRFLAATEWYLGLFDATEKKYPRATCHYRQGLIGALSVGDHLLTCKAMTGLAAMAARAQNASLTAQWLGAINGLLKSSGARLFPFDLPWLDVATSYAHAALDESTFVAAYQTGILLTPTAIVERAETTLAIVEQFAKLPRSRGAPRAAGITAREQDVLNLIAAGKTDREIAEDLFISLRTVNAHVANILAHLDVHSRREAVARGQDLGMLPTALPTS